MKVLILQDYFPPLSSAGAEKSTFDLAKGLLKAGCDVSVIAGCEYKKDEGTMEFEGLKLHVIHSHYNERWRSFLSLYNPMAVGKVKKLIKEINPDVIHAHNVHHRLSYYCLRIARKHTKAVFWTARDVMSFSFGKLATYRYLKNFECKMSWKDHVKQAGKRYNPFRNILIRRYLKYPAMLFSVSYALKRALAQNGIKNVRVSYTGVDVNEWQTTQEIVNDFKRKYKLEGKRIIFFGGRISDLKGADHMQRAMERVKKQIPEAFLLIAGSVGIGWLKGEELKACYHAAEIVVVPSICFDCFPRTNIEAMACRKPVIATPYGGSPEIVRDGETGYIVNPLNIDLMAKKVIELLSNRNKAKQFGEAGFQRVKENFTLSSQVAQTISWYQKYVHISAK